MEGAVGIVPTSTAIARHGSVERRDFRGLASVWARVFLPEVSLLTESGRGGVIGEFFLRLEASDRGLQLIT